MTAALALPPHSLLHRVRVLEHLTGSGLLMHAIALALLLPNRVVGSQELSRSLQHFGEPLRERCERLFVRAPREVRAEQIESEEMRVRLTEVVRAIVDAEPGNDATPPDSCLIGEVALDRIGVLLLELERAPLGSVIPWAISAELLGTTIRCRGVEYVALTSYRTALARRLTGLAEQSPEIFLRALVEGGDPALQTQLRGAVDALHAAAALAA